MSKATITIFTKRLPLFVYDEILRDINESIMVKSYVSKDKANIKSDLFSISIVKVEGNGLPMQYRGIRESLILLDGIEPTEKEILEFLDPSTNGSVKGYYFKYDDFMRISDITKYTNMAQYVFGVLHRGYKRDIEDKIKEREEEQEKPQKSDYIKLKQSDAWIHRNAILELECDSEGCLVVVTHTHVYEEKYHSLSELNNEYDRIKDFLGVKKNMTFNAI